jgi:hypothetical protein
MAPHNIVQNDYSIRLFVHSVQAVKMIRLRTLHRTKTRIHRSFEVGNTLRKAFQQIVGLVGCHAVFVLGTLAADPKEYIPL